jgi:1-deoxy-D-xylulose-5-phosphate synthase
MAPKDENELQHMMKTAINHKTGPVAIRYPRGAGVGVPLETALRLIPWGRGEVLSEGKDIAILAIGNMVAPAVSAAAKLREQGINAKVINARFVKPLDRVWLLDTLKGIGVVVTVEENVLAGGFGSAIKELLEGEPIQVKSIGIPDRFIEHGTQAKLRSLVGLTDDQIAETVRRAFQSANSAQPHAN